jgi:hypothetical protein
MSPAFGRPAVRAFLLIRPWGVDPLLQESIMREDHSESADTAPETEPDDDAGLSRAERRAKARGKQPQQQAKGQPHFVPKGNASAAKRNYANRRSG